MTVKTIKAISSKSGANEKGPWTIYTVEFTGGQPAKASSFDAAVGALEPGDTWDFELEKNGNFWNILEWRQGGSDPIEVVETASVSSEVWDAKDRATYMESAYKSATKAFSAMVLTDSERLEMVKLARWIYQDILDAREGKALRPIPSQRHIVEGQ